VREARRFGAQRAKELDVLRRVGKVIIAANDVGNLHFEIVHHVGEMKNPGAVRAADGHIGRDFDVAKIERHLAANQVVHFDQFARETEAPGAAILVEKAGVAQLCEVPLVSGFALALEIRAVIAAHERAFVPIQSEPAQAIEDHLQGFGCIALLVRVLDAQDELAAGVPCVEPVEQRGSRSAHVQIAGGRRSETNADRGTHKGAVEKHRTSKSDLCCRQTRPRAIRCSVFGVRCSMFIAAAFQQFNEGRENVRTRLVASKSEKASSRAAREPSEAFCITSQAMGENATAYSPNAMHQYVEQLIDLTDPAANRLLNLTVDAARERVLRGTPDDVRAIEGSFALVARDEKTVRLARSLDRPLRYFLAKRHEGPALIVADRIDAIRDWLDASGLGGQFIRVTRAWCRRITSSRFNSSAARIPIQLTHVSSRQNATRCRPISMKLGAATSERSPMKLRNGSSKFPSTNRWASASPAASTAARCSSRLITCYGSSG
jgi:hypothetical protein